MIFAFAPFQSDGRMRALAQRRVQLNRRMETAGIISMFITGDGSTFDGEWGGINVLR